MSTWSQILLQERNRSIIQLLSLFHDYSLAVIVIILVLVIGASLSIITNKVISDSVIVTTVEVVWTVVPILILLILAVPSLQILYLIEEIDPYLTIKIIGHQWYWEYNLADLDINFESYILNQSRLTSGEYRLLDTDCPLVLPTNKNIRALVTAADVIHCWTVPRLGVKIDAVPGRLNQIYINIIRPGIISGQCSEICGSDHRFIPIQVEAISPTLFINWVRLFLKVNITSIFDFESKREIFHLCVGIKRL